MTAITDLAARLATLDTLDALPDNLAETARQRLFDSLACFQVGAATQEGQLMRRLVDSNLDNVDEQIRYSCAATRCTELDDIHIGSCTTPGSIVVPVAVISAASCEAEDRRVLGALIAGYQAMTSLGRAVDGTRIVYEGVWPTYLTAPFGAAAAGARVLGLNKDQTSHALGIAATRCVGTTGQMPGHATSRWFTVGCAASDGYRATSAAAHGMHGDPGVFERVFGRATGVQFDASVFAEPAWSILDIDVKPFRVGRQALSAVEAYLTLGKAPDAQHVRVWVPRQVMGMLDHPRPTPGRLGMGLQFQLAGLTVTDASAREAFMGRVQLAADDRLSSLYPRQWGARVEITHTDGSTSSLEVLDPQGSAHAPFDWTALLEKHRQAGVVPSAALDRLYELCRAFGRDQREQRGSRDLLDTLGLA